jgi:hypothetical protein
MEVAVGSAIIKENLAGIATIKIRFQIHSASKLVIGCLRNY